MRAMALLAVGSIACALLMPTSLGARAESVTYDVSIDTSPLVGHPAGPFAISLALIDGDGIGGGNNTVSITNVDLGGGVPLGNASLFGGAHGSIHTSINLTDSANINLFAESFLPGSTLQLSLTVSKVDNVGRIPDRLSIFIADSFGVRVPTLSLAADDFLGLDLGSVGTPPDLFGGDPSRPPSIGDAVAIGPPDVTSNTPPTITLPSALTADATNAQGAVVRFDAHATDVIDGEIPVVCDPASGSQFPVGVTSVVCSATNSQGAAATGGFTVTVMPSLDGRMIGAGFIEQDNAHHHFAFRVFQRNAYDDGRFHYWVRVSGRCIPSDDDFGSGDDEDGDVYNRDRRDIAGHFEATSITTVTFADNPAFRPRSGRRGVVPSIDSATFAGAGNWKGRSGYSFEATATDKGEPGRRRDTFSLIVRDAAGKVVASVSDTLDAGNVQSTRLSR